jgi:hypothetical protein
MEPHLYVDGRPYEFLTEAECPACNQTFGACKCGFFNKMTLEELVWIGFARYLDEDI